MQDLTPDVIGTNPKYPSIVDHSWLQPQGYDNYPSDNNSVRVLPKLADLWNTPQGGDQGFGLVPNLTLQHTGSVPDQDVITPIVCAAKKAMMAGLRGKALADHLRSRFASNSIVVAKEALAKLSEEQGLLLAQCDVERADATADRRG